MRRLLRPSLVLVSTAVALVGGGCVIAFAGWTSRSTSETFTITAAKIPQIPPPTVTVALVPIVSWGRVRIARNTPVHRYVVTRHLGSEAQIVCSLPARSLTRCVDLTAPIGSPVTYTVRATHGKYWTGVDSEPSLPLGTLVPVPTLDPSGVPIPPTSGPPTSVPPATTGVSPLPAPSSPAVEPTSSIAPEPSTADATTTEPAATSQDAVPSALPN